jgi:hypothetical protein
VLALRAFAKSDLYKRHVGLEGPGASMEEVDGEVHDLIKIFG